MEKEGVMARDEGEQETMERVWQCMVEGVMEDGGCRRG